MVTNTQLLEWLNTYAQVIADHKDYLTQLDAAIGDADHGININRGFQRVVAQLPDLKNSEIGNIFKTVSMTLISSVGGASGPLYGTFFLRASQVAADKFELTDEEMVAVLQAGVEGVVQRGKATLADKTMLDTLQPAIEALTQAINSQFNTLEALQQAVMAAENGMKATIPMIAKKGRASYLGERSAGHQDPGATSAYLMLTTLLETLQSSESKSGNFSKK